VDAIVNAANRRLLGGGGVDGAIHRAAGQELYDACLKIGGCMEGEAVITPGFKLPAKWVIHTVGPIYGNENGQEAQMLHSCYMNSLYLAMDNNVKTIAFPNISTGVYGYPIDEAAPIAIAVIFYFRSFKVKNISISTIFISFSVLISTSLGIIFFSESVNYLKFVGIALILLAIILINYKNSILEKNH